MATKVWKPLIWTRLPERVWFAKMPSPRLLTPGYHMPLFLPVVILIAMESEPITQCFRRKLAHLQKLSPKLATRQALTRPTHWLAPSEVMTEASISLISIQMIFCTPLPLVSTNSIGTGMPCGRKPDNGCRLNHSPISFGSITWAPTGSRLNHSRCPKNISRIFLPWGNISMGKLVGQTRNVSAPLSNT